MRRLNAAEAQKIMNANRSQEAQDREQQRRIAQGAVDTEDRMIAGKLGFKAKIALFLFRKQIAALFKGATASGFDRGTISQEQARILNRSLDNRIFPEAKP